MIKVKNSRGNNSHTLGFAILSFTAATGVFIAAAVNGQYLLTEYGTFMLTALAPYVFKEYTDKNREQDK